jgi:hypothetical protein
MSASVALIVKIYEILIESVHRAEVRFLKIVKSLLEIAKPGVGRGV